MSKVTIGPDPDAGLPILIQDKNGKNLVFFFVEHDGVKFAEPDKVTVGIGTVPITEGDLTTKLHVLLVRLKD